MLLLGKARFGGLPGITGIPKAVVPGNEFPGYPYFYPHCLRMFLGDWRNGNFQPEPFTLPAGVPTHVGNFVFWRDERRRVRFQRLEAVATMCPAGHFPQAK